MSSDLIETLEDDNGVSIGLEMTATGYAFLSLFFDGSSPETTEYLAFCLSPTDEGLKAAETIENALREWREHIKAINVSNV